MLRRRLHEKPKSFEPNVMQPERKQQSQKSRRQWPFKKKMNKLQQESRTTSSAPQLHGTRPKRGTKKRSSQLSAPPLLPKTSTKKSLQNMSVPGLRFFRFRTQRKKPPHRHSRLGRRDKYQRHSREVLGSRGGRARCPRRLLLKRHQYRVPCGPEQDSRASQAGTLLEPNAIFVPSLRSDLVLIVTSRAAQIILTQA